MYCLCLNILIIRDFILAMLIECMFRNIYIPLRERFLNAQIIKIADC